MSSSQFSPQDSVSFAKVSFFHKVEFHLGSLKSEQTFLWLQNQSQYLKSLTSILLTSSWWEGLFVIYGTDFIMIPAQMIKIPIHLNHISLCFKIGMERRAQNTIDATVSIW